MNLYVFFIYFDNLKEDMNLCDRVSSTVMIILVRLSQTSKDSSTLVMKESVTCKSWSCEQPCTKNRIKWIIVFAAYECGYNIHKGAKQELLSIKYTKIDDDHAQENHSKCPTTWREKWLGISNSLKFYKTSQNPKQETTFILRPEAKFYILIENTFLFLKHSFR